MSMRLWSPIGHWFRDHFWNRWRKWSVCILKGWSSGKEICQMKSMKLWPKKCWVSVQERRYRVSFTPGSRLPGGLAVQISICRFRMCSQCRRQRGKNFGGTLHKSAFPVLGTIFETDCKKGLKGKGVEFVRQICARCPIPVYAIGGMNLERISLVRQAGAAGGCMMSGFMKL